MSSSTSTAENVKLIGGRLCLDFVNTVGGRSPAEEGSVMREDKLHGYRDLSLWSRHAGSVTQFELHKLLQESARNQHKSETVFKRAIHLREALYKIFEAVMKKKTPSDALMKPFNTELQRARERQVLTGKSFPFAWQWKSDEVDLDRPLWPIVISAAELLTTGELDRIRRCGGEDCGWLFEDTSKNGRRQWCDMSDCGNLAKVRRFRSKIYRKERRVR